MPRAQGGAMPRVADVVAQLTQGRRLGARLPALDALVEASAGLSTSRRKPARLQVGRPGGQGRLGGGACNGCAAPLRAVTLGPWCAQQELQAV